MRNEKGMDHEIMLGSYDTQEQMLPLASWIELYYTKTGYRLNAGSMRKRRACSGLGYVVPPKTYLLTRSEFEQVMDTPLPMCRNVIRGQRQE